jgi:signal transduction histidine kinase
MILFSVSVVKQFITTVYFELFLICFTAIMALAVSFLCRALIRSRNRERTDTFFTCALVLAQEEERSRISRELHDTVAQDLRYLALRIGKISRTADHAEREDLCAEVAKAQEELISRVRGICENLGPQDFRFQGLPDALRRLCYDFGRKTGIDCRIDVAENLPPDPLNEKMLLQVFRIVQEALTNIEKHAEATEAVVVVRVVMDKNEMLIPINLSGRGVMTLFISISDNGKGFTLPEKNERFTACEKEARHLGIRGMYERAAILRGALTIESEESEGTFIRLEVPFLAK